MAREIRFGPNTRIINSRDIRLSPGTGVPMDFTRDHVIFLDANSRPVAECWPIESARPDPDPAVVAPKPAPQPGLAQETPHAFDRKGPKGPLTESQKELLERTWKDHPGWGPAKVGEEFEKLAGRTVSVMTVNAYKPA